MKIKESCVTCDYLTSCKEVNDQKLTDGYKCKLWQAAPEPELLGRRDIERKFGTWALKFEIVKTTHEMYLKQVGENNGRRN